jgi:hypothetical protein
MILTRTPTSWRLRSHLAQPDLARLQALLSGY